MLKVLREKNIKVPPVVVYTGKEPTKEENTELQKYTQNIIIKGVISEERLLDETKEGRVEFYVTDTGEGIPKEKLISFSEDSRKSMKYRGDRSWPVDSKKARRIARRRDPCEFRAK